MLSPAPPANAAPTRCSTAVAGREFPISNGAGVQDDVRSRRPHHLQRRPSTSGGSATVCTSIEAGSLDAVRNPAVDPTDFDRRPVTTKHAVSPRVQVTSECSRTAAIVTAVSLGSRGDSRLGIVALTASIAAPAAPATSDSSSKPAGFWVASAIAEMAAYAASKPLCPSATASKAVDPPAAAKMASSLASTCG